jgi:non-ribosomal peptide synthetase component F
MSAEHKLLFTSRKYREHITFWKPKIAAVAAGFSFSGIGLSGPNAAGVEKSYEFTLEGQVAGMLGRMAHQEDRGIFVLILSAINIVFSRCSTQQRVVVKTPRYRKDAEEERYTSEVLLVQEIDEDLSLREFIIAVQKNVSQSYKYQNLPLSSISEGDRSIEPAIHIFVRFARVHEAEQSQKRYGLTIEIDREGDSVSFRFIYDEQLFDETLIQAIATSLRSVLSAFSNTDQKVKVIDLLSNREPEPARNVGENSRCKETLNRLFEKQVEIAPEAIALTLGNAQLTYGELNQRANQVAHHLQRLGVGPDVLVAVALERSMEMIVALLGVLKAGSLVFPGEYIYN